MRKEKVVPFVVVLILVCVAIAQSDILTIKKPDGSTYTLDGTIKGFEDSKFVIELGPGGELRIAANQITAIKVERSQVSPNQVKRVKPVIQKTSLLSTDETFERLSELVTVSWTRRSSRTGEIVQRGQDDFGWFLDHMGDSTEYMRLCKKLEDLKKLKVIAHPNYRKAISLYVKALESLKQIHKNETYLDASRGKKSFWKVPKATMGNSSQRSRAEAHNRKVKRQNAKIKAARKTLERFRFKLEIAHEALAEG